jgi:hypothetical protein
MQRADERTRTADLPSLRVINRMLQGFARGCNSRISKPVSLLGFARCCTVLRSRWYQSGINVTPVPTSTKDTLVHRFYNLLRKATHNHSVVPTAAPRLTFGCICSNL